MKYPSKWNQRHHKTWERYKEDLPRGGTKKSETMLLSRQIQIGNKTIIKNKISPKFQLAKTRNQGREDRNYNRS